MTPSPLDGSSLRISFSHPPPPGKPISHSGRQNPHSPAHCPAERLATVISPDYAEPPDSPAGRWADPPPLHRHPRPRLTIGTEIVRAPALWLNRAKSCFSSSPVPFTLSLDTIFFSFLLKLGGENEVKEDFASALCLSFV